MDAYRIIRRIGRGSYGDVWLARHKDDLKQCVIKRISLKSTTKSDLLAAHQEVRLLSSLKHPNIVSYRDSFTSADCQFLYIAMGYCEGGDLYTRIQLQNGQLFPENLVAEWFIQICLALQYLHDRHILHRDLKSQNIFLTRQDIVKVGDLGIARVLKDGVDMATTLIGTPYYMSPEVFSNKPYSYKSDIWALGCCLYEMATLGHPFNARDINSLMILVLQGKLPKFPSYYCRDFWILLKSLLQKDTQSRPSVSSILQNSYIRKQIRSFLDTANRRSNDVTQFVAAKPDVEEPAIDSCNSSGSCCENCSCGSTIEPNRELGDSGVILLERIDPSERRNPSQSTDQQLQYFARNNEVLKPSAARLRRREARKSILLSRLESENINTRDPEKNPETTEEVANRNSEMDVLVTLLKNTLVDENPYQKSSTLSSLIFSYPAEERQSHLSQKLSSDRTECLKYLNEDSIEKALLVLDDIELDTQQTEMKLQTLLGSRYCQLVSLLWRMKFCNDFMKFVSKE